MTAANVYPNDCKCKIQVTRPGVHARLCGLLFSRITRCAINVLLVFVVFLTILQTTTQIQPSSTLWTSLYTDGSTIYRENY